MIQPQTHNNAIGAQHGLTKLTETLEALATGQKAQQTRDTQTQVQLTTLTQAHQQTQTQLATVSQTHTATLRWVRMQGYVLVGVGLLTLAGLGLLGWQLTHPPQMEYVRALGAVDSVLVQVWGSLPKAAQVELSSTYSRLGLVSPNQRK